MMKNEIYEIPGKAQLCYEKNKELVLPCKVPYIGMGSSYFAPMVFKYLGVNIFPELASEFFYYGIQYPGLGKAVLISQSGKSSETLWCADKVKSFAGIMNDINSPLGTHRNLSKTIELFAGKEDFSSTKTYINTLITLYLGFGFNPGPAIEVISRDFSLYETEGERLGKKILKFYRKKKRRGVYIIGNGPNIATSQLAALVISESTKIPVQGMAMAQYDHGVKEAANGSFIIAINPKGKASKRASDLLKTVKKAGATTFELNNFGIEEEFSPLVAPVPFFFAANYIAEKLEIDSPFIVGGKVTTVT